MTQISFNIIPENGDIFFQGAADSLINQRPILHGVVVSGKEYSYMGRIISSVLKENGCIYITLEIGDK